MSEHWTVTFNTLAEDFLRADWYYQYSDDYSAYNKGRNQVQGIIDRINKINWTPDSIDKFKSIIIKLVDEWYPGVHNEKYTKEFIDKFYKIIKVENND